MLEFWKEDRDAVNAEHGTCDGCQINLWKDRDHGRRVWENEDDGDKQCICMLDWAEAGEDVVNDEHDTCSW